VITDLQVGGVPLHLFRLVQAMGERGFTPSVVSLAKLGPVARMIADDGITVHDCGGRGGWDIRVLARLTRIIRKTEPEIIHALLFHANVASRLAAWEVGFPSNRVLCEIQTVEVERPWHLLVDRWTHRGCRFIIGNSPSVVEHLASRASLPRDRLRLVRGGIDPSPIREANPIERSALGLPADVPIVLWVGRLDPVKGLSNLIDAFPTVAADYGAHLLLAGTGPLHGQLSSQIERLGLSEHFAERASMCTTEQSAERERPVCKPRAGAWGSDKHHTVAQGEVHLLGARHDIPQLLKTADVFAFPSRAEGLPNALLEAMAASCPIVTTDVPGCRDLIQHEQTGLVVPYGDTTALIGAIRLLLDDRALASRLGQAAATAVKQEWYIDKTHAAYEALYREVRTTV